MTAFTAEDVAELTAGGNQAFNAKYLAKAGRDFQLPTGNDVTKLRDFIRAKYVDKKWYAEEGANYVAPAPAAEPANRRASVSKSAAPAPAPAVRFSFGSIYFWLISFLFRLPRLVPLQ